MPENDTQIPKSQWERDSAEHVSFELSKLKFYMGYADNIYLLLKSP